MICLYCGKEFQPKTKNQKFCCRNHGDRYRYDTQRRKEAIEKTCPICGTVFTASGYAIKRIYCGDKCLKAAMKKRRMEGCLEQSPNVAIDPSKSEIKICPVCKENFVATRKNQKYCSEKCTGKAKWQRKKERLMKKSPTKTNASLSEIARLSRENGMTYGEYVAAKRI